MIKNNDEYISAWNWNSTVLFDDMVQCNKIRKSRTHTKFCIPPEKNTLGDGSGMICDKSIGCSNNDWNATFNNI